MRFLYLLFDRYLGEERSVIGLDLVIYRAISLFHFLLSTPVERYELKWLVQLGMAE